MKPEDEKVAFKETCGVSLPQGHVSVDEKLGIVLLQTLDCTTGESTIIYLARNSEELSMLGTVLAHFHTSHMDKPEQVDLTPADKDFYSILNDLKHGTKH